MKNLHQLIIISLGVILGMGWASGALFKVNSYTYEKAINFEYCWPLFAYLVALAAVGLIRLTISTGDKENGNIEATTKTEAS